MTIEEIKRVRLFNHHLIEPSNARIVVRELCGMQAQFLSNAFHALRIRSTDFDAAHPNGLIKSWTLRGTMHLFDERDLPLMLYRGHERALRACDTMMDDEWISAERKRLFADLVVRSVENGIDDRDGLKRVCFDAGMTEIEAQSVFNSWGGTLRALCEQGVLTHAVSERKAFVCCPPFDPMEKEAAELELARRYFTHYGPATIRDAAYFFGCRQADVRRWLAQLPVVEVLCEGKTYYVLDEKMKGDKEIPACIFLAGFDSLMLGYEKKENPFLPSEHLRGVFSLAGIVQPTVLLRGRVVGRWKRSGKILSVTLFEKISTLDVSVIRYEAMRLWPELTRIEGLELE